MQLERAGPHAGAVGQHLDPGLGGLPQRRAVGRIDGVGRREAAHVGAADEVQLHRPMPRGDHPRQLGRLMRRMSEISGEKLDPEMQEAVRRLESGEDPEKIEEDMGDLFGEDAGGGGPGAPTYDDGLYPM